MDFHINKGASLPILKMELIKDGRYNYKEFHDKIQNSEITFCMKNIVDGSVKIGNKPAICILKNEYNGCEVEEYYLAYQFTKKDTSKPGTYVGDFKINFLDGSGTLIVPIREELYIHVLDGSIKK
tara:strand:- start:14983 stop:15357 length:375 start_codon:yes stop_codon:yes gene_type:complete